MIQPTDLRIGNIVTDEFYDSFFLKKVIVVDSINSKGINLCIEHSNDYPEMQSNWIEPYYTFDQLYGVPLTEEWLKRMGFIKESFSDQYRLGPRLLIKRKHGFYDYGSNVLLKHVHRLQNFWYELEGSELTINL